MWQRTNNTPLIEGYEEMVLDRLQAGERAHFLSFMFNPLAGNERAQMAQMCRQVERTYAILLTRMHRRPQSAPALTCLPLWLVVPDWPVPKRDKDNFREIAVNDGLHLHAIVVESPLFSRLKTGLSTHIEDEQRRYTGPNKPLFRIKAQPIIEDARYVVGYGFKSLKRRRITDDEILVLPRTNDEMPKLTNWEFDQQRQWRPHRG